MNEYYSAANDSSSSSSGENVDCRSAMAMTVHHQPHHARDAAPTRARRRQRRRRSQTSVVAESDTDADDERCAVQQPRASPRSAPAPATHNNHHRHSAAPPATCVPTQKRSTKYDSLSDDSDSSFEEHLRALQINDTVVAGAGAAAADDDDCTGASLLDLWSNVIVVSIKDTEGRTNKHCNDEEEDARKPAPPLVQPHRRPLTLYDLDDDSSSSSGSGDEILLLDDAKDDSLENNDTDSAWKYLRPTNEYTLTVSSHPTNAKATSFPPYRIPASLFDSLYAHQTSGVQFMASLHTAGIGGILGDDMGMGKTFMTLAYLGGLMRAGTARNALIVAPLSVLRSWQHESLRVLVAAVPTVHICIVSSSTHSSRTQRVALLTKALECSSKSPYLIITTYGMVRESTVDFSSKSSHWDYVVLDEGHTIKNPNVAISQACRRICEHPQTHRLMLSGTPIMNHLKELWAVFDWATAGQVLGDSKAFARTFARTITAARDARATKSMMRAGERANAALQELLKPYFLQRLKVDFLADLLPSKTELVLWTHLSAKQRTMYAEFVQEDGVVRSILRGEKTSPLEAVTWLKKLCGHPILIEQQGKDLATVLADMDVDTIVAESAKLELVRDLVDTLVREQHKTLLFSQSTRMLDILQTVLQYDGVSAARIDGSTHERDRQRLVDEFNATDNFDVLLLSTKAAGVGLTCTGASRVIVYDPSWNPAEDSQAVDRCYRIGQTKEVLVYRMIAAGTVEEKMYEKQIYKDGIRRTVFTEGATSIQRYFATNELRQLFALAEPGVCTVMEKVKDQSTDWSGQQTVLKHRCAVGLSRHDGFYNPADADVLLVDEQAPANPPPSVLGRSQRVLVRDSSTVQEAMPLGRPTVSSVVKCNIASDVVNLVDDDSDDDDDVFIVATTQQRNVTVLSDSGYDDAIPARSSSLDNGTGPMGLAVLSSSPVGNNKENVATSSKSNTSSSHGAQPDKVSVARRGGGGGGDRSKVENEQRRLLKQYMDELEHNDDDDELHRKVVELGRSLGFPSPP